jgi:hypothetical protein
MRTICLILALALACPASASAQLRFSQPAADLGELRGGPAYQHRFDFVNESTQPLDITDIRLGCGCLQPVLDKRSFKPGEKGTLLMNLRTLGQPNGVRAWQSRVLFRQGGKIQEAILIVAAKIRNEITIEPSIVAMSVETTLRQELTITDHRMMPMKIKAIVASSPAIRVSTQPTKDGATKVVLEVARSGLTAATQEEMLNIYTDDPHYRHLQVPITLTKAQRAEVSATPSMVEVTGSGSQLVRLRGAGEQMVRIERADADHPALKCTWAAGPGNDATLKIVVNAALLSTPNALASVRVQLAAPAGATLTIPIDLRKE